MPHLVEHSGGQLCSATWAPERSPLSLVAAALQVTVLPQLRVLKLEYVPFDSHSLEQLSSLAPSLTQLQLLSCKLPPTLSLLTGLRSLVVLDCATSIETTEERLGKALPSLPQLTALTLSASTARVPPSVTALSCLEAGHQLEAQRQPAVL